MPTVWYEVTAVVRKDLQLRYEAYMREKHIRDVLATGAFARATFDRAAEGKYRIRYEAHSQAAIDRYITDHAPRLRADALAHFPDGVDLSRDVWTRVDEIRAGTPTPTP